jgi:hypothetical protein
MDYFMLTFDFNIKDLVHSWTERKLGIQLNDETDVNINHIQGVDDLYLIAAGPAKLQIMINELEISLAEMGSRINDKFRWITNMPVDQEGFILQTSLGPINACVSFESMGWIVSVTRTNIEAMNYRTTKGWRCFWANSDLLLNRSANLESRLHMLDTTCKHAVCWASEVADCSKDELKRFDHEYFSMAARVVGLRRNIEKGETWYEWQIRSFRAAGHFLAKYNLKSASQEILVRYWRFAQWLLECSLTPLDLKNSAALSSIGNQ